MRRAHCRLVVIAATWLAPLTASPQSLPTGSPEDIVVVRSVRLNRSRPTDYCNRAGDGFDAVAEDTYDFVTIAIDSGNGRVTNTDVMKVGDLRACFGRVPSSNVTKFFAEGRIGDVALKGLGDCTLMTAIAPADGIVPNRCHLVLSELTGSYTGGLLTTNTIGSKIAVGEVTDPPGYTMASIATVRLWRK